MTKRECDGCLKFRRTMPVRIYPGWPDAVVARLCLDCRLNWVDTEHACLATTIEHAPKRHDPEAVNAVR